jgi:hypothetical protein
LGLTLTGCPDPEPENYGTIRIELAPLGGDANIVAGTATAVVTVNYGQCLQDFYLSRNPAHQQDGVEGSAVFQDWAGRLCSDFDRTPDCEVVSIEQLLLETDDIYTLKITYKINDPTSINYRELRIGPLPTEDFAGCTGASAEDSRPFVTFQGMGAVLGRDAQESQLWRISSYQSPTRGVVGQGAPIKAEINYINPPMP